jgi:hypothetical protein
MAVASSSAPTDTITQAEWQTPQVVAPPGLGQWTPAISGGVEQTSATSFKKTTGNNNTWDGQVYSVEGYLSCCLKFCPLGTTVHVFIGLNSDPTSDATLGSIDWAWYLSAGNAFVWVDGSQVLSAGAYTESTRFGITYDGNTIRFYKDGVLIYAQVADTINGLLYVDSSFYEVSTTQGIQAVNFGQMISGTEIWAGSITASELNIDSIFSLAITVPSGGRIRYSNGKGIQKRCVQLAKDRIDFIDTPNNITSLEVLRARIGRLGVGGAVLMDGDFVSNYDAQWGAATALTSYNSMLPAYLKRSDGNLYVLLERVSDGKLVLKKSGSGTSGAEVVIPVASAYTHCIVEDNDGVVHIAYRGSNNYIYEITSTDLNTWSSPVQLSSMAAYSPRYGLVNDGIRLAYRTESASPTMRIMERVLQDGTWSSEVEAVSDGDDPSYAQLEDGTLWMVHQKHSTGYIWLEVLSETSWVAQAVISDYTGTDPHLLVSNTGVVYLSYSANVSGSWYVRTKYYNPTTKTWSSEVTVDPAVQSWDADFVQLYTGELRLVCMRADGILLEYAKRVYAKIGSGVFMETRGVKGESYQLSNGLLFQFGWESITMGTGIAAYAITAPKWFKSNTAGAWSFSITPSSHWSFQLNGDQPNAASNARNVIVTNNGAQQTAIINWIAMGQAG